MEPVDPDDVVGLLQRGLEVAPVELARPDEVRAGLVVEDAGVLVERMLRVDDDGERLVLDLDELGGVARELARARGDHGHGIPQVAHLAHGEGVVLDLGARGDRELEERIGEGGHLLADEHAVDAFERLGRRNVDARDRRVRVRRAHEVDVADLVPADVVDEDSLPLYEPLVLLARNALAGEALLRGLDLLGRSRRHADTSPFAAAEIASTMFT